MSAAWTIGAGVDLGGFFPTSNTGVSPLAQFFFLVGFPYSVLYMAGALSALPALATFPPPC